MVQVLEANRSFGSEMGKALGKGVGAFGNELANRYVQGKEDEALKKLGVDMPKGITAQNRPMVMAELLRRGMITQGQDAQVPLEFQKGGATGAQPSTLGSGGNQTARTPQGNASQGNVSQTGENVPASKGLSPGKTRRILDPAEIEQQANENRLAKQAKYGALSTNYEKEKELLENQNLSTQRYQQTQEKAGDIAHANLMETMPGEEKNSTTASPDLISLVRREAEEIAGRDLSPAQQETAIKQMVKERVNMMSNIDRALGPGRTFSKITRALRGTGRSAEKAFQELQLVVKPALDAGLHDDVREMLDAKDLGAEEVERVVSNLDETAQKNVASFPKIKEKPKALRYFQLGQQELDPTSPEYGQFQENFTKTLQEAPNTNLILLRKAYEDKGVDWRSFLDTMNGMRRNGEFTPNVEQSKQLLTLTDPPLNYLEELLNKAGLRGR